MLCRIRCRITRRFLGLRGYRRGGLLVAAWLSSLLRGLLGLLRLVPGSDGGLLLAFIRRLVCILLNCLVFRRRGFLFLRRGLGGSSFVLGRGLGLGLRGKASGAGQHECQ